MVKLFLKFSMGSWLSAVISLFTTPIVTALIVPEEFGKAAMYTLAFNLVLRICLVGIDQGYIRNFYKSSSAEYQKKLLYNAMFIPAAAAAGIACILFIFSDRLSLYMVGIKSREFGILLGVSIILGVFERFFMLSLRMNKLAVQFSLLRVLFAVVTFLVIFLYAKVVQANFFAIVYANVFALAVCTTVAVSINRQYLVREFIDRSLQNQLLRYGFPFLPTFIAVWVFEGIDRISLRQYSSFKELGMFSAAYKIVALLTIMQTAFSNFWAPVSYELYEKNAEEASKRFSDFFYNVSVAFFIGGLTIILFKDVIILLFDSAYHDAASIMPFLLLIPIMYTLSEVTVGGINYKGKTHWHLFIAIICAIVNYMLNRALVPSLGAKGAAVSTGTTYVLFFYIRTYIAHYFFPMNVCSKRLHKTVILFLAAAFVNTFYAGVEAGYITCVISLAIILYLYQREIKLLAKGAMERFTAKKLV